MGILKNGLVGLQGGKTVITDNQASNDYFREIL